MPPPMMAPDPAGFPLRRVAIEDYQRGREVARGGMGRILAATDNRHHRPVALKELLRPSEAARARFRREALITAGLQHPGIVPIYEAGTWPDGSPFYAMRLVEGRPLDAVVAETTSLAERLALLPNVIAVADAIAYAHSRHIIHRDLKPSNVLVGDFGETVVIDWGLAKHLGESEPEPKDADPPVAPPAQLTRAGAVIGTPAYMSPEQAWGHPVDERADVYALGALLYFVLTGTPPFFGTSARSILAQVIGGGPEHVTEKAPALPPDLATIVDKAMARDPAHRYPTAAPLVADLKHFATGQLVSSHDYSVGALFSRWLRRHRATVAVAALASIALLVLGLAFLAEHRSEQAEHLRARRGSSEAALVRAHEALGTDPTAALTWLEQVDLSGQDLSSARSIAEIAVSRGIASAVFEHQGSPVGPHALAHRTSKLAGPFGAQVVVLDTESMHQQRLDNGSAVLALDLSPDGEALATASRDSRRIWDLPSVRRTDLEPPAAKPTRVLFSPRGRWLASAGQEPSVYLLDRKSGEQWHVEVSRGVVHDLAFLPDDSGLVTAGGDGTVRTIDLATRRTHLLGRHDGDCYAVAVAPDGALIASAGADGALRLWSVTGGNHRELLGHVGSILDVAFSPDGTRIATAGQDRTVRLWNLASGEDTLVGRHDDAVTQVVYFPNRPALASSSLDHTIRVWDLAGGDNHLLAGHAGPVLALAVTADDWLASGDGRGSLRFWRAPAPRRQLLARHEAPVQALALSPDSHWAVSAATDGAIRATHLDNHQSLALVEHGPAIDTLSFTRDGRGIIAGGQDHTVRVWHLDNGSPGDAINTEAAIAAVEPSPDGSAITVLGEDSRVTTWSLAGDQLADLGEGISSIARASDATLALGAIDGNVIVKPPARPRYALRGHLARILELVFSADNSHLASCDAIGVARIWEVESGRHRALPGPCLGRGSLAFSPDGSHVAIALRDSSIAVLTTWNDPARATILRGHTGHVNKLLWSADGAALLSCADDDSVRVWNLAAGSARTLEVGHRVRHCLLTTDDDLVTGDDGGYVWSWPRPLDDPVPRDPAKFAAWLASATTTR